MSFFDEKLRQKSATQIPTCKTKETRICTVKIKETQIRTANTICTRRQNKTSKQKQIKKIQGATVKFLYSGRAIDNTIMHALNKLSIGASEATEEVQEALDPFLDCLVNNPNAEIIYRASDMQLNIDSNAAYLVAKQARSCAGGYHYLGNLDKTLFNDLIYILAKIIKAVMASAAESECGSSYINAQHTVLYPSSQLTLLEELGHKQQAVLI